MKTQITALFSRRSRLKTTLLITGLVSFAGLCRAGDPAAAEQLFREGRKLLEAGKIDEACIMLANSQSADPSSGTLGSLASCHEKQGKIATAWAEYLAAAQLARIQKNDKRADEAERRAKTLEAKLSRLTIKVPSGITGLVIVRDADRLDPAVVGTALPTDPGEHTIKAEAPGYTTYSTKVVIGPNGDNKTVEIPALTKIVAPVPTVSATSSTTAAAPAPSASAPSAPAASSSPVIISTTEKPSSSVMGYVIGGVGLASLGVGAYFGISSLSKYGQADEQCSTHTKCSAQAVSLRDTAETYAWGANIALGIGVVGVGLGTYLVLTSGPSKKQARSTRWQIIPSVGTGAGGVLMGGAF